MFTMRLFSITPLSQQSSARCIGELVRQCAQGDIDMDPPYQRGRCWDIRQQEMLIDTISWGLPIPALILRELPIPVTGKGPLYEMVDGKQRLTALVSYVAGVFPYRGTFYQQEPVPTQRHFRQIPIAVVQVSDATDDEVRELYRRINFCGVPHEKS
jgi:hypothetical protein